jgi:hypothetical protein
MGEVAAGYYLQATEDHDIASVAVSKMNATRKIKEFQILFVGGL